MQDNIYAAPEAPLTNSDDASVQPAFYIVSVAKFLTLYIFTFSLYGLYWHYKNWKRYKLFSGDSSPMPIMRAIFSIFFTHSLFSAINVRILQQKKDFTWNPAIWASIAVLALVGARISDQFAARDSLLDVLDLLPIPLMIIYGLMLLKAQRAINISCNDPTGKSNSNFTLANCVWIFLGSIFLTLIAIGLLLPADGL